MCDVENSSLYVVAKISSSFTKTLRFISEIVLNNYFLWTCTLNAHSIYIYSFLKYHLVTKDLHTSKLLCITFFLRSVLLKSVVQHYDIQSYRLRFLFLVIVIMIFVIVKIFSILLDYLFTIYISKQFVNFFLLKKPLRICFKVFTNF